MNWEVVWEVLSHSFVHAIIDSAKMLPLLIAVYLLIEYLEYKRFTAFENSRFLKGNLSPVFGALFGCIPQCGFSVVSTDLFAVKKLSVGALVAVYIATSDEALPILFSATANRPSMALWMVVLIAAKIVIGIGVGYLAMWVYPKFFKKTSVVAPRIKFGVSEIPTIADPSAPSSGCCNHDIKTKRFNFFHPVLHSLKIFAFIFAVNLIMGIIVESVGEDNLSVFLQHGYWLQPLLAVVVGIIPNCASSVVVTNLFVDGMLSFGSVVSGLCVNAGLGILVLFRKNRPMKENFFIMGLIVVCSLFVGYVSHVIEFLV